MPAAKKEPAFKAPKTLGACIDKLYTLREARLKAKKVVEALASEYSKLEDHVIAEFPKDKLRGAKGVLATAGVETTDVPTVEDWDKLYKHIKTTGSFDLLERRVSRAAVGERWANKKSVPGVGAFGVVKLSLHKAGAAKGKKAPATTKAVKPKK